jgi:hypothetical protein
MDNKQSTIEWLVEKLNQCEPWYSGVGVPTEHINDLINKARAMEKEQMDKSYSQGYNFGKYGEESDRS